MADARDAEQQIDLEINPWCLGKAMKFDLKQTICAVAWAVSSAAHAQPFFFEILEKDKPQVSEQSIGPFLTVVRPDGQEYESFSIAKNADFITYYSPYDPKTWASPENLLYTGGCILSQEYCRVFGDGVEGFLERLNDGTQWLTPGLSGSMYDGLITAFSSDGEVQVGYGVERDANAHGFHSDYAFVRLKDKTQLRLNPHKFADDKEGNITRVNCIQAVEPQFYLVAGSTAISAGPNDAIGKVYKKEKKGLSSYPGYNMQAALWLVNAQTQQRSGPFLAPSYITDKGDVLQTASVNDIAQVNGQWVAVGYSSSVQKGFQQRNRAVYWKVDLSTENMSVQLSDMQEIELEQGQPTDGNSTLFYAQAQYIRSDGLIVGQMRYQKPQNRNLPYKVFTFKIGRDKQAQTPLENQLFAGADHGISSLGNGNLALGWATMPDQTNPVYEGSARLHGGAIFDLENSKIYALNQWVGEYGYQNGYFYRIQVPQHMLPDGSILASAFRYQTKEAYLGREAGVQSDIVIVQLKPVQAYTTAKNSDNSLEKLANTYQNQPAKFGYLLPAKGSIGCISLLFLAGLLRLRYRNRGKNSGF